MVGAEQTMWCTMMGAEVRQHYVDAGGVRTRVITAGSGDPLVLLHGTGGHAEAYQRNILPLAENFTVHAVDMLGHGFTDRPDCEYSVDDYADHVVAFLDALGMDRSALAGESLGASVASWVAVKYPDRVSKLICNTGILVRTPAARLDEMEEVRRRTRALAADLTLENIERRLAWLVKDPKSMTAEMAMIRYRIYSQPGFMETAVKIMDKALELTSGVISGDVDYLAPGVMGKIQCPVLFLWTTHNPGKPVDLVERVMRDMPNSRLEVVEDAGHWPQFEKPDEVNEIMTRFLLV